jgi:pyroglutamyl-peptidase
MARTVSRRILLTGFEPFADWTVNSSWEGARLAAERLGVEALLLPVDHQRAAHAVAEALAARAPEIALLCGLAKGETMRLERRARRPAECAWADGPTERWGAWPWDASLAAIRASGAPARFSDDCGRYVCETAYRAALDRRAAGAGPRLTAFLHTPPLSEDWPADRVAAAIKAAVGAALAVQ